jgi:hypothetical protein
MAGQGWPQRLGSLPPASAGELSTFYHGRMDWYRITCWRCRSDFMDPRPGNCFCMSCGAPPIGMRGDGQYVRHQVQHASLPDEPPAPRPWHVARPHVGLDENGEMRLYYWRMKRPNGTTYVTRRRLSEEAARGICADAEPVGEPEIIRGSGHASTTDFLGTARADAPAGVVLQPQAGPLPGWRDGQQHQWSRDSGRTRRHR